MAMQPWMGLGEWIWHFSSKKDIDISFFPKGFVNSNKDVVKYIYLETLFGIDMEEKVYV